jgi:PAS domain S-box-containing protein
MLDRRELAFVAMERTRMPMVVTDPRQPDNPIVLANRSFLEETGYTSHELIGRNCRILQGPDTDPSAVAEVRRALADEREITIELLNYRKDGTTFWNQLYISPIHDDAGRLLHFFALQMDVTRRREAEQLEAAEHLLLREVDHRAKNALALVQGIVRLSKRNDANAFADAVQGRVDALARAHSILADARWRDVPLERIVRSEVEPLGGQVRINGDPAELAVVYVQPVALLLHELAANARHHGSCSVPEGELSIEWWQDPSSGEIRICWSEDGGPPPAKQRVPGYGHAMIDAIAARQLRGWVDYNWSGAGLRVNIAIAGRASR